MNAADMSNRAALDLVAAIEKSLKGVFLSTDQQFELTDKLFRLRSALGGSPQGKRVACVGKMPPLRVVKPDDEAMDLVIHEGVDDPIGVA